MFPKGFTLTLQKTRSIHDSMNIPNINFLLVFTFYYKYLKCKKYNLGMKTVVLYLKKYRLTVYSDCKMEKRNSQLEYGHSMEQTRGLFLHVRLRCGSLSITTPVSLLANEFDVRSVLLGQMSLAAVNQILCNSRGYERLQKSKDSLKDCFENVIAWPP